MLHFHMFLLKGEVIKVNQRKIGVILSYLTLGFNVLIGLVYTPFMISCLGDSQYGIFSLANSLISFVTLLDLGFGQTLVRYISKEKSTGNKEEEHRLNGLFLKIYTLIAIVAMVVGIGIIVVYPQLASTFTKDEVHLFRVVFSILLVNVTVSFPMSVFSATLNAYEEFFALKLANFIMSVCKYTMMFLLLVFGHKLIAITITTLIASFCMQVFYMIYAIKKTKIRFDFSKVNTDLTRDVMKFSFFIFLNLIIDFLYSNTDKLILGVVAGTVSVSIYSIGIYFSQYFTELSSAMSGVFLPKIVDYYEKGQKTEISALFNKVGRLQMMLLFLVLGGYFCLGRDFISLWVGDTYKDSYLIGMIIMIPSIVPLTQNIGISVIRAMNVHKYRSYMYIIIAVLNVTISIPLAIKYGGVGSAIGTGISTILGQILFMNWFYYKRVGINIKCYWENFIKFMILTLIVIMLVSAIKTLILPNSWLIFISFVFVFVCVYMMIYWFVIANEYEKKLIKSVLMKGK